MVRKPTYKAFKLDDKELKSALGADGHFGGRGGAAKVPAPGVYRAIICDVEKGEYKSAANAGLPRLVVDLKIIEGPTDDYDGAIVKDFNVPLQPHWKNGKLNYSFPNFWEAVGAYDPDEGFLIPEDETELVDPDQTVLVKIGNRHNDRGYVNATVETYYVDDGKRELEQLGEPLKPKVVQDAPAAKIQPASDTTRKFSIG